MKNYANGGTQSQIHLQDGGYYAKHCKQAKGLGYYCQWRLPAFQTAACLEANKTLTFIAHILE